MSILIQKTNLNGILIQMPFWVGRWAGGCRYMCECECMCMQAFINLCENITHIHACIAAILTSTL